MVRAFDIVDHDNRYCRFDILSLCLLDVFPFPVLVFGFYVGEEFISLDNHKYTHYE